MGGKGNIYVFFPNFSWHNVTLSKSAFDSIFIRYVFSESVFSRSVFSRITYQMFPGNITSNFPTLQVIFHIFKIIS